MVLISVCDFSFLVQLKNLLLETKNKSILVFLIRWPLVKVKISLSLLVEPPVILFIIYHDLPGEASTDDSYEDVKLSTMCLPPLRSQAAKVNMSMNLVLVISVSIKHKTHLT